jgi:hypothetical protein
MKQTLITYTTKPERSDENARLIQDVFDELRQTAASGLHYFVLRAENGRFFHFIQVPDGATPFAQSEAFAAFQQDIKERLLAPAQRIDVALLGSYGMVEAER